jgi:DNA (cytosine-5)-methyltransferase 1
MSLYEEILFLKHHFKGKWVVENVKPYYKPLIKGKLLQRHLFWSNFDIDDIDIECEKIRTAQIPQLQKLHGINLDKWNLKDKRQLLRNCVHKKLGLHILQQSEKEIQKTI